MQKAHSNLKCVQRYPRFLFVDWSEMPQRHYDKHLGLLKLLRISVKGRSYLSPRTTTAMKPTAQALLASNQTHSTPSLAAVALLEWTERHASRAVIIPVCSFESRRVRWTFRHKFAGQPVRIEVSPFDSPEQCARTGGRMISVSSSSRMRS
jgi:hypothetical protein